MTRRPATPAATPPRPTRRRTPCGCPAAQAPAHRSTGSSSASATPARSTPGSPHNIGFEVANRLAAQWDLPRAKTKFAGLLTEGRTGPGGPRVAVLLPQTYMNDAGRSVGPARGTYKLALERVLVVHDEIDLPFGDVRARIGGGLAGHNGLKSLKAELGSADFARVRDRRRAPRLDRPRDRLRPRARRVSPVQGRGRRARRRRDAHRRGDRARRARALRRVRSRARARHAPGGSVGAHGRPRHPGRRRLGPALRVLADAARLGARSSTACADAPHVGATRRPSAELRERLARPLNAARRGPADRHRRRSPPTPSRG